MTDPVGKNTGYAMTRQTADIVTMSHDHPGHTNLNSIKPEFKVIQGPGEYEMNEVFVTGIRTYHDSKKGAERGYNTAYVIELEGMRFAHLGDLGHTLTEAQAEEFNNVDVLMVPVGGGTTITAELAADLVSRLGPKAVIPMQYQTAVGDSDLASADAFTKLLGIAVPEPVEKLVLKSSDLTDTTQIFMLTPDK